jgi:hypothetical protein
MRENLHIFGCVAPDPAQFQVQGNDFSDFLKLAVEDFMERKDARGYFRLAGIGIISEDKGESDVNKIE